MENAQKKTGYPSIDKSWLKYYSEEAINAPLPECTIYEYIWQKNRDNLDEPALIYFGNKITYRRLFQKIDCVADAFSRLGVKRGDVVSLLLPNIPENVICVYGLNKIGAIADLIDLRNRGELLQHYLMQTNAKIAVICTLFAENVYEVLDRTRIQQVILCSPFDSLPLPLRVAAKLKAKPSPENGKAIGWKEFIRACHESEQNTVGNSEDTACIFHTSGTTGEPKGVMMTNGNFNAMAVQCWWDGFAYQSGDTLLNQVPPFLAYNGIMSTHLPLSFGMKIHLLPDYEPPKFAANVARYRPNHVLAGPADWGSFLQTEISGDYSYLRTLCSGSDSIAEKDKKQIEDMLQSHGCHEQICEGYGMTEIGSAACTNLPQCNVEGSVGIPLPKNIFCVFDNETGSELSYGEVGEICMTGPTVMKGYYNNPKETQDVLKQHSNGLLWLHSGDLGRMDENGCVYLEGRLKRIIVRHDGIKVSPFVLEKAILKHPLVSGCCVVGSRDQEHGNGQIPIAFLVVKAGTCSLEEIKKVCNEELSENYRPSQYYIIKELPLTPNGKVDYRALEREAEKLASGKQDM